MRSAYGVAAPVVSKIKVPSHNRVYKVGAGEADYIVKVYADINFTPPKKDSRASHLNYESAILDRLEQSTVSVIPVCRDAGGRSIHEVGKLKAMVFPYIDGSYFDNGLAQVTRSASVLAKVHRCLPADVVPIKDFDYPTFLAFWLARLGALSEKPRFSECIPASAWFLEIGEQVRRWFDHAIEWQESVWIHGHGDVNPRNFIYRDSEAFLFDFQAARLMPRLGDISDGMIEFGIAGDAVLPARAECFLQAYEAVFPLADVERRHLNEFLLADCMIKVVCMIQSDIYFGYKVNAAKMKALLDYCEVLTSKESQAATAG